MSTFLLSIGDR